jgi:hypothetical protein
MSTNYSHFERSAPVGGAGLYVGEKGNEVEVASSTGQLYQQGAAITATAAEINQVDGIGGPALAGKAAGDRVEFGREAFTNSGTAAADVTVAVTFASAFSAAPVVTLGKETTLDAYISTAASTTGVSITVASVPAGTTVYVNWIAIGQ